MINEFDLSKTVAVVLRYDEPGWTEEAIRCCNLAGIDVEIAERHGVGNMSRAFNDAVYRIFKDNYYVYHKYLLWVTNVTFEPELVSKLIHELKANGKAAAIHPAHKSDHPHLHPGKPVSEVPFIELTCTLFNIEALEEIGDMDINMPYWGMDLDWSWRAKEQGYVVLNHPDEVKHTYLRHMKAKHPVSAFREQLRKHYDSQTVGALEIKYGKNWRQKLWPAT